MSEYGLNQLCFAPYMDNTPNVKDTGSWKNGTSIKETYVDMHEWQVNGQAEYKKGYASKGLNISPDVSTEMTARYDTLQTYIRTQVVAFIKGGREMSEYSTFVNDLKSMGIEELLAACNA